MKFEDLRIDLDQMEDLQPRMKCSCGRETEQPEYVCIPCQIQLVFFVKQV